MTGKKEPGIPWHHTSVRVRADIFSKAHEQGIDISRVCNKALAELLGVDYRQQPGDVPVPRPVIIAQNGPPTGEREPLTQAHPAAHSPVINADDPAASATVRSAKRQPDAKPGEKDPKGVSAQPPANHILDQSPPASAAPAGKAKKPAGGKDPKNGVLKKFFAAKIARSDADDAVCSKDDVYQAFVRWCREHKIAPVMERRALTVALKNKFALSEKTVNGAPCWVNVRLK